MTGVDVRRLSEALRFLRDRDSGEAYDRAVDAVQELLQHYLVLVNENSFLRVELEESRSAHVDTLAEANMLRGELIAKRKRRKGISG